MSTISEILPRRAVRLRSLTDSRQQRLRLECPAWLLMATLAFSIPVAASSGRSSGSKALPPQIIAYIFPRDRALQPAEVAAGKLTRINYAFANIQDGRIVQRGKHAELIEQGGLYAEFYELQVSPEESLKSS